MVLSMLIAVYHQVNPSCHGECKAYVQDQVRNTTYRACQKNSETREDVPVITARPMTSKAERFPQCPFRSIRAPFHLSTQHHSYLTTITTLISTLFYFKAFTATTSSVTCGNVKKIYAHRPSALGFTHHGKKNHKHLPRRPDN